MSETSINHVADTAIWVAYYRAKETERSDALFRDPLAKVLVGERGKKIAEDMKSIGRYTEWAVVSRTVIIDDFIQKKIEEGIDTVVNLGTGLDTRPYRLNLPKTLQWIEVDYPQIIELKNNLLKSEVPRCQLTRVELDLSDHEKRKQFFMKIRSQSKKVLILTEGVIPYLSEQQVSSLAMDLNEHPNVVYWITEFFKPEVYRYLKASLRSEKMKNAPFQFFPANFLDFFDKCGWNPQEIQYPVDVSIKSGRKMPMPWWVGIFNAFASKAKVEMQQKMTGYMLLKKRA